ncbi:MAG: AraC family transcriptional regulator [Planctomycetota bacterium]|nr:MAG: AraC family transcriptional regulator [Planctomycetota bacterium]
MLPLPPHLLSLERVSIYQSRRDRRTPGRIIDGDMEEIELLIGGGAWFEYQGQRLLLESGHMLWHRGGERTVHEALPNDPYRCLVVGFRIKGHDGQPPPRLAAWRDAAAAVAFAEDLVVAFHRGDVDRRLLCAWAYTTCRWQAHAAGPSRANPVLPPALRRALQIIAGQFTEELDLPRIASNAGISCPHLHALFRQHLGSTPAKVLEERRLRQARRLLAEADLPISDIAAASGFRDAVSFSRAFKRRQGMTPSVYRRRYSVPEAGGAESRDT